MHWHETAGMFLVPRCFRTLAGGATNRQITYHILFQAIGRTVDIPALAARLCSRRVYIFLLTTSIKNMYTCRRTEKPDEAFHLNMISWKPRNSDARHKETEMQNNRFESRVLGALTSSANSVETNSPESTNELSLSPGSPKTLGRIARRMRNSSFATCVLLLIFLVQFATLAYGQFTSNVQGTVFDPSSRVVPGATVTLKNLATGLTSSVQTNDAGLYHFVNVPPGNYTITVEANGFQKAEQAAVLTADSTAGIDVRLEIGQGSSTITVSAVSTSLNPDETRLQATIESATIASLPLQNNSVYSTIAATPGVTGYNDSRFTDNFTNEHTIEANANGTYFGGNGYILDGVVVDSNIVTGEVNISPNPDSLQEVTLQTNTFSAQYGGASSVVTEMASKSGTNALHGSANYLFTNQDLIAGTEFVHGYSPFKRHDLTAALGGPIIKDRTFIFASGEMKRASEQGLVSGNGENGSVGLVTYNDPAFTAWSQAAYPNTHGTYILSHYLPTDVNLRSIVEWADPTYSTFCFAPVAGCSSPYLDQGIPTATPYDNGLQLNVRGDQYFRQGKDKLFINSYRTKDDFTADDIRPAFDVPAFTLNWYENLTYSHVFSSNFMNIARMSVFAANGKQNSNNLAGIDGGPLSKLPYLSTNAEGISFGGNAWGPATFIQHNYDFNDLITYIHGRHAFKIGFDYYHGDDSADFSAPRERPSYTFANLVAFAADQVFEESGVTFNPLTGQFSPNKFGDQNSRVGSFVQDEWKIKPSLLLSLGIRWDDMGNATPYNYPSLYPQIDNLHLGTGSLDNMFATAVMRGAQHVFNHGEVIIGRHALGLHGARERTLVGRFVEVSVFIGQQ